MKIKSIKIQNLGPYQDVKVELDGAQSSLIFINGNNGRGKTTFLNALKWCLFKGTRPPIARASIAESGVAKPIEARVEIEILKDNGQVLLIEKSQLVTVMDDKKTERPLGQAVISGKLRESGRPTIDLTDASQQVDELLPKKLENFILFDAEQLAKFFNPETRHAIEEAVYQIAGVEKLDLAIGGIKDQLQKFQRTLSGLGGKEVEGLQRQFETEQANFDQANDLLNSCIREIYDLEEQLSGTTREIARHEIAIEKMDRIDSLREDIDALTESLRRGEIQFTEGVILTSHLFLVGEALKAVDRFYEEGKNAGYPLAFPSESLRELLSSDNCVCGCNLSSSKHRKNIQDLLRHQAVAEGVDKSLPTTKTHAMGLRGNLISEQARLRAVNTAIADRGKELSKREKDLKSLEMGKINSAEWDALFDKERRVTASLRARKVQRDKAKTDRDVAQRKMGDLQTQISKAAAEGEQTRRLKSVIKFLTSCLISANETKSLAITKVREDLEQSMNAQYSNIKGGTYQVQITESFGVQLRNQDSGSISEGETMSLAYAFAIAIRTALGMQFPLVVDSAFGKLDSENRLWLTKSLVQLILDDDRRQAMFLMHDLEYTPSTATVFRDAMPKELYLNHNVEAEKTTIEVGIDPTWKTSESSPWFEDSGEG